VSGGGPVISQRPWAWALFSGVLLTLCFPPSPLGPLSFVALVPLGVALEGCRGRSLRERAGAGLRAGFLAGLAFFGLTLYWILFLPKENLTYPPVLVVALVLMVAYLSLYPAVFGLAYALSRPLWGAFAATAVLWPASEFLRSQGELGFPWASIAYSLYAHPSLIQGASFAGMWGVGLWIAAVNGCVLSALLARSAKARVAWAAAGVALVAAGFAQGRLAMAGSAPVKTVRVALVQPNVSTKIKWDPARKDEIFERLIEMTRAAQKPLDLVVWPETATPTLLLRDPPYLERVRALAMEKGVPIVTGFPHSERDDSGRRSAFNSASMISADGKVWRRYDKIHLVPFSERFPFQNIVPFVNSVDFGQSDFTPGSDYVIYEIPKGRFGILICFESLFPEISREYVLRGADFLLNITNDAWFGRSQAPLQHASMAVFRAVEHRIGIGRAANTGISMIIDRYGRIEKPTDLFVQATVVGDVDLRSGTTFYTRHGDYAASSCLLAGAAMVVAGALLRRRGSPGRGAF